MNTHTKNRSSGGASNIVSSHRSSRRPYKGKVSRSKPQSKGSFRGRLRHKDVFGKSYRSTRDSNFVRRGRSGRKMLTFDPSQFINKNPVNVKDEVYKARNTFDTFGVREHLSSTIRKMGLTVPTPIQDQIIPEILVGNDVIGLAETGTGKTAAFLIPLIENTLDKKKRQKQTLILVPTRELALQIEEELRNLAQGLGLNSVVCIGGVNIRPQIKLLRRNNQFIIGTPGRVLDLINKRFINTNAITTVVLDEADRMLDMGFINDMKKIISQIPKSRETLLFLATMAKDTNALAAEFLKNPVTVSVKKSDVTNLIEQDVIKYGNEKFTTLVNLLKKDEFKKVIVFGAMKYSVKKLAQQLSASKIKAESIHGNKNHSQRQLALSKFKKGDVKVLVATDVAARGIHVDDVTHVINYDLPNTFNDYVHRIGRTGRGTKRGKALTFVASSSK